MKRFLGLVIFFLPAFSLALGAGLTSPKPDFSGVWNFDLKASRLQTPAPDSAVFRIEHKDPNFRLTRTFITKGKEDVWTIDLTTDGQEVVQEEKTEVFRGRLTWQGNDLFLDSTITMGQRVATNRVTYHLSDDGRTFTATEIFRGPYHKHDNVWVFNKG